MIRVEYMKTCAKLRSRLQRRPRTLEYVHIAKATGISANWLNAFARGRYSCPKEAHVKKLADFLTANGL